MFILHHECFAEPSKDPYFLHLNSNLNMTSFGRAVKQPSSGQNLPFIRCSCVEEAILRQSYSQIRQKLYILNKICLITSEHIVHSSFFQHCYISNKCLDIANVFFCMEELVLQACVSRCTSAMYDMVAALIPLLAHSRMNASLICLLDLSFFKHKHQVYK